MFREVTFFFDIGCEIWILWIFLININCQYLVHFDDVQNFVSKYCLEWIFSQLTFWVLEKVCFVLHILFIYLFIYSYDSISIYSIYSLIIFLYHQVKIPIGFWYRWDSTLISLIHRQNDLLVELTRTHILLLIFLIKKIHNYNVLYIYIVINFKKKKTFMHIA